MKVRLISIFIIIAIERMPNMIRTKIFVYIHEHGIDNANIHGT